MFTESMLESGLHRPGAHRWMPLASFAIQSTIVLAVAMYPLLRTESLSLLAVCPPVIQLSLAHVAPQPDPPGPANGRAQTIFVEHPFEQPQVIPHGVQEPVNDPVQQSCVSCSPTHSGPIGDSLPIGPPGLGPMIRGPEAAKPLIVSEFALGELVHKVVPAYPDTAKRVGIQGDVILTALIGRDGSVESLEVNSGNPFLVRAATDAVRQWRYRPYRLNGEAVKVETQITVRFSMNR